MTHVVEHLAALTAFRDRDVLDVSLVGVLRDLLQPLRVAIYRHVGEGDERRWLTRANLGAGDLAAAADPLWADPATLAPLPAYPDRQACVLTGQEVIVAGEPSRGHFPLATDSDVVGVLEIASRRALAPDQRQLVGSILRIFRNFQDLLDYSERDTLTGLLNRKTFDDAFMRHAVAPPPDVPAAPSPGAGAAAGVFERLRRNVEHFDFPRVGHITVSVGFTELSDADTPTSAFERADKAIYFAKEHGRNQVVSHADLVAAGEIVSELRGGGTEFF